MESSLCPSLTDINAQNNRIGLNWADHVATRVFLEIKDFWGLMIFQIKHEAHTSIDLIIMC
jgi:hypothetical protein